jgi:hypothetical protein
MWGNFDFGCTLGSGNPSCIWIPTPVFILSYIWIDQIIRNGMVSPGSRISEFQLRLYCDFDYECCADQQYIHTSGQIMEIILQAWRSDASMHTLTVNLRIDGRFQRDFHHITQYKVEITHFMWPCLHHMIKHVIDHTRWEFNTFFNVCLVYQSALHKWRKNSISMGGHEIHRLT